MKVLPFGVRDEPMSKHTSLHIGGPADYFVRVTTERDLVGSIAVAREHELPVLMLGGGTNMLVSDRGVRGVVLQNDWSESSVDGATITAASGTPLAGSGRLHGAMPRMPGEVLPFARAHGGHRLSWQPEAGVRQALVIVPVRGGGKDRFVVAGRSLREVEQRKRQVLRYLALLWGLGLAALAAPALLSSARRA